MIDDFIQKMRLLDLVHTELEGDDWCTEADRVLQEAADWLEHLNEELKMSGRRPKGPLATN